MRSSFSFLRSALCLVAACSLAGLAASAQMFTATTGSASTVDSPDAREIGPSVPGHHRKAGERLIYARVRDGVYSVDGMVAKVRLDYDVQGAEFLYLFVPGVGTAVVSVAPNADAIMTQANLHDDELSFNAGGHRFALTGVSLASDRGTAPAHLYVRLDRSAWSLSRLPMVGFGNRAELPYEWPGALRPAAARTDEGRISPPVPATLLPSTTSFMPSAQSPVAVNPVSLRPVALRQ